MSDVHQIVLELVFSVDWRASLSNDVFRLVDCRQVLDVLGDLTVLHAPIRRFQETVLIGARVGRQTVDQPDVWSFRRLDGANPTIVSGVDIAHLKSGSFTG